MLPPSDIPPPILTRLDALIGLAAYSLHSESYGVVALAAIVAPVLIVLTQFNEFYGDTIGYGLSILLQGIFLRTTYAPKPASIGDVVTWATIYHGLRLAAYLHIRRQSGYNPHENRTELHRLLRIPEACGLAVFYAFLICPVYYLLLWPLSPENNDPPLAQAAAWSGACLAWVGVLLETVADAHKFALKLKYEDSSKVVIKNNSKKNTTVFRGPTGGLYRFCRHPNYAGEIMFWLGIWLSGLPSFCRSLTSSAYATAGLLGLMAVVLAVALRDTEKEQDRNYGGQLPYKAWRRQVRSPIVRDPDS